MSKINYDDYSIFAKALSETVVNKILEEADVPLIKHEFSPRFERKMNRLIKKETRFYFPLVKTRLRKTMTIIVTVIIMLSVSCISVSAIRSKVSHIVKYVFTSGEDSETSQPDTSETEPFVTEMPSTKIKTSTKNTSAKMKSTSLTGKTHTTIISDVTFVNESNLPETDKNFSEASMPSESSSNTVIKQSKPHEHIYFKNYLDYCVYDEVNQKCIIGDSCIRIYPNGMAVSECCEYDYYILTPAEGVKLTAELLGLPENCDFTLNADGTAKILKLKYNMDTNLFESNDLDDNILSWLEKGVISKADIEYGYNGKCLSDPHIAIRLDPLKIKHGEIDIDEFIADYPEYEFTSNPNNADIPEKNFSFFDENFDLFTRAVDISEITDSGDDGFIARIKYDCAMRERLVREGEKSGSVPARSDILRANRVWQMEIYGKSCCNDEHRVSKIVPFDVYLSSSNDI